MIQINLNKAGELDATLGFPTKWDELLPDEMLNISKALISGKPNEQVRADILLFIIASRAKEAKVPLPKKWINKIDPEAFFLEGDSLLDFLFKENGLTVPPEKTITLKGTRPYEVVAPSKGFNSLTCGEFEDAEIWYALFLKEEKMDHLAALAAVLWRPEKTRYQTRKDDRLETYPYANWKPMFMKLERHRLYAIYIWYTGCKMLIPKIFPTMHEPDEDAADKPVNDPLAFTKCVHAGAGPKNGTRENIRLMSLKEFLFDMEQEAIKAKELKQQYKDAGSK